MRTHRIIATTVGTCSVAWAIVAPSATASSAVIETGAPSASAWSPDPTATLRPPRDRHHENTASAVAAGIALRYLGVPYVWGGASPAGFDCSGLPAYAYAQVGISVPHYTVAIWNAFPKVPSDELQVGDLVFFHDLGHMGLYLGGGRFVHAPHTGDVVKVSDLATYPDYVGAVRPG